MVKLLFLDMDGAGANSWNDIEKYWNAMRRKGLSHKEISKAYDKKFKDGLEAIFPDKARLVSKIIAETDAKIIWSTSWRLCEPYKNNIQCAREMLLRHNMPGNALIGYTPDLDNYGFRADEIKKYLEQNYPDPSSCRCAVLDDWDEAGYDLPDNCRFFQTREKRGLTFAIAERIINYLNNTNFTGVNMIELTKHCRVVNNYVFFLKGPFSQWYQAGMEENGIVFNCCEQYMMYHKAVLFRDKITAERILNSSDPYEQKRLGRMVRNFVPSLWDKHKENIVFQGNYLKFTQNADLRAYLMSTGERIIVEANKYDPIWGIGMFSDDRNLLRTELWGQNLLGKAIMKVRERFLME